MQTPLIIVNFKTYPSATGRAAIALAKLHEAVAQETGVTIGVAVGALDVAAVAAAVSIPVFGQHVDAATAGAGTGAIVPELLKSAGAIGTLINHSEKRVITDIAAIHAAAKRAGLTTIVCAESAEEAAKLAGLHPDFLAVEPPELIGGDISVTTASPDVIINAVKNVKNTALLVGAGVKNSRDVATAIALGAKGVLLASGVTKAADPIAVLHDLATGAR